MRSIIGLEMVASMYWLTVGGLRYVAIINEGSYQEPTTWFGKDHQMRRIRTETVYFNCLNTVLSLLRQGLMYSPCHPYLMHDNMT